MDVENVEAQYMQEILRQRQTLQNARQHRGRRPQDWKSRDELYMNFMMHRMAHNVFDTIKHKLHTSIVPPAYLPCNTPLAELQRVSIRDLQLETHHRGAYLLVRAITPPRRMTAVLILVEDEQENVTLLQLYHQETDDTRATNTIVNDGTVMILKEPFFKLTASGEYGLRVDHLSDIIEVDKHDPRYPDKWLPRVFDAELAAGYVKSKGNEAFNEGKYWQAIELYSTALMQQPEVNEAEIIKRNRALAYLKTKQFDAALSDTNFPNFGPQPSEKTSFRAAEALYHLQRFDECRSVLEKLTESFPNNARAGEVLERARNRCLEQVTGNYNFKRLQTEVKNLRPPQLDHATYIGPVEIRQTPNKGRGLFVTKAVQAGDLLLCEKAFSHAWVDKSSDHSPTLLLNIETNRGFAGGQADLLTQMVQKLYRNPSLGRDFRALYHGDYESVDTFTVDGQPIVDTFLVERIMSYNVFGCPLSSLNQYKDGIAGMKEKEETFGSCGIWLQASYINHSCLSNVRRSFIGDMMIVRATRDLKPDTELTFRYQDPQGISFEKLEEKLQSWGFTCQCAMCEDARETPVTVVSQRENLQEQMKRLFGSWNLQINDFETLVRALDNTYTRPANEVPRLLLWEPQLFLVRTYVTAGNARKAMDWIRQILSGLGFEVVGADLSTSFFTIVSWGMVVNHLVEVFLHAKTAFDSWCQI